MQELDKETQKILNDGQKIENFVESDDWKLIKKKLYSKLITFDSISGIVDDKKSMEEIGKEAIQRDAVVDIILKWIQEIESEAAGSKIKRESFESIRNDSIIEHFN